MKGIFRLPILIVSSTALVASFSLPAWAASNTFLPKAQEYYQSHCTRRPERVHGDDAVLCYTFDKVGELQTAFTSLSGRTDDLEGTVVTQSKEINQLKTDNSSLVASVSALESRVKDLEDKLATPATKSVYFAQNRPQPFDSDWIDTTGYSLLKINLSITGSISQYDVQYSDDKVTYTKQVTVDCYGFSVCAESYFGIHGKYYRISTGTASGNVTATGLLYN